MRSCRITRCCEVEVGKTQSMRDAADTLPNDVEGLKSRAHELEQSLEQRDQFIHQLLEQIKLSRHQHFGSRSERNSLDQIQLAFNEA